MTHNMSQEQAIGAVDLPRKQVLKAELNHLIEKITIADIDIKTLERTDPSLQVGQKVAARKPDGTPLSYTAVNAKNMLEERKRDREGYIARLNTVEALLKEEK